jgi:hypothetical protein
MDRLQALLPEAIVIWHGQGVTTPPQVVAVAQLRRVLIIEEPGISPIPLSAAHGQGRHERVVWVWQGQGLHAIWRVGVASTVAAAWLCPLS